MQIHKKIRLRLIPLRRTIQKPSTLHRGSLPIYLSRFAPERQGEYAQKEKTAGNQAAQNRAAALRLLANTNLHGWAHSVHHEAVL